MKLLVDAVGWIGALSLILAYAAVSFRKMASDGTWYQLMNAVGSFLLIINTVYYHAYPSAFVNVVWISIAVIAHIRIRARSYAKQES
jgi:hypothetical protein